ncbi:hypothetical protein QL996_07125 [Planococcus sp. APC 4015]|nr:hypothetical protein [Planococcus sp. APC 4015]
MTPIDTGILDIERDTADAHLRDQEWIDTEFLAIMTASGMTADVTTSLLDDGAGHETSPGDAEHTPHRHARTPVQEACALERVRSPPRRGC